MMAPYQPGPRLELLPRDELLACLRQGLLIAAALLVLLLPPAGVAGLGQQGAPAALNIAGPKFADFKGAQASGEAQWLAHWVHDSGDNRRLPFVILDKRDARIFVFDAQARLLGSSPVLLGSAAGDDSVAGIGDRPIAAVRPEERTTPAGRFDAETGRNSLGEDVLWVDYEAAVSMHRVRATEPGERRLQRLASPTPTDNRISYGCINVPLRFYEDLVASTFRKSRGVVYVLPERKPLRQVFPGYDVARKHGLARAPCTAARCGRGPIA